MLLTELRSRGCESVLHLQGGHPGDLDESSFCAAVGESVSSVGVKRELATGTCRCPGCMVPPKRSAAQGFKRWMEPLAPPIAGGQVGSRQFVYTSEKWRFEE